MEINDVIRWAFPVCAAIILGGSTAGAQTAGRPSDSVFVRAQQLVSDGNGAAGRALVDSVLAANAPTSRVYPEALFYRATLAASAADAESDYKHIVVDYPLAPQAEDALLRLAQLELARGDRDGALVHLQRIPRDYPHSKSLARANYWMARVYLEKNDLPNACAANASALAQVGEGEIELQNQIQYQGQRCASYNVARVAGANPPVATTPGTAVVTPPAAAITDTLKTKVAGAPPSASPPVSSTKPAGETPVDSAPPVSKPSSPKANNRPGPGAAEYSVQVAAYNKKTDAQALVSSLIKRGYQARVDGSVAPFRVRIGRYPTTKEAEAALKQIKAKRMDGFVVRAPER
jgi:cell division septation protein DedD